MPELLLATQTLCAHKLCSATNVASQSQSANQRLRHPASSAAVLFLPILSMCCPVRLFPSIAVPTAVLTVRPSSVTEECTMQKRGSEPGAPQKLSNKSKTKGLRALRNTISAGDHKCKLHWLASVQRNGQLLQHLSTLWRLRSPYLHAEPPCIPIKLQHSERGQLDKAAVALYPQARPLPAGRGPDYKQQWGT